MTDNTSTQIHFDEVGEISEGLALVRVGNKYGYADEKGNIAIPLQYDDAGSFISGVAYIGYLRDDWQHGFINKSGDLVVSLEKDEIRDFDQTFEQAKLFISAREIS